MKKKLGSYVNLAKHILTRHPRMIQAIQLSSTGTATCCITPMTALKTPIAVI